MNRRPALFLLAAALVLPACAATQEVRVGTTVVQGFQLPSVAQQEQCGVDVASLQQALDAYILTKGAAPPDGQALVTSGFLREFPSDRYTVVPSADGTTATLTGIGPCAG